MIDAGAVEGLSCLYHKKLKKVKRLPKTDMTVDEQYRSEIDHITNAYKKKNVPCPTINPRDDTVFSDHEKDCLIEGLDLIMRPDLFVMKNMRMHNMNIKAPLKIQPKPIRVVIDKTPEKQFHNSSFSDFQHQDTHTPFSDFKHQDTHPPWTELKFEYIV